MSKRELLEDLPVRRSENICTGCYTVPSEWFREDDIEKCAECGAPRDESKPAFSLSEEELRKAVEG
jgi:hypothetical protein